MNLWEYGYVDIQKLDKDKNDPLVHGTKVVDLDTNAGRNELIGLESEVERMNEHQQEKVRKHKTWIALIKKGDFRSIDWFDFGHMQRDMDDANLGGGIFKKVHPYNVHYVIVKRKIEPWQQVEDMKADRSNA